ncbi:MAG: hypothetical protein AB7I96_02305 [Candidatus Dadabacteria bacterium]
MISNPGRDNCKFLVQYQLRNPHRIYKCRVGYKCVSIDPNGVEYSIKIHKKTVENALQALRGREWSVNTATVKLEPLAEADNWKIHYGHKLGFYVQDILLVIAAKGDGEFHRAGRGYTYIVY